MTTTLKLGSLELASSEMPSGSLKVSSPDADGHLWLKPHQWQSLVTLAAEHAKDREEIARLKARIERQAEWLKWPGWASAKREAERADVLKAALAEALEIARRHVEFYPSHPTHDETRLQALAKIEVSDGR